MKPSVFSGMQLSGQLPQPDAVPVDQRLFAPTSAPSKTRSVVPTAQTSRAVAPPPPRVKDWRDGLPAEPTSERTARPEIGKEGKRPTPPVEVPLESARLERPLTEPKAKTTSPFDINEKPWRKDSFVFTDAEFDRLEDFKLELRRRFELKATKNDIARAAFQYLYEEYSRDPAKSAIVRHLRLKKS